MSSVDQGQTYKETEENLRVFKPGNEQLVERVLQESLVDLLGIHETVCVDFDLDREDLYLVSCYLELVGLAVELQAVDRLHARIVLAGQPEPLILTCHLTLRCPDKSELHIRIQVRTLILER